ncbi:hypothetical protein [Ramlibacter humi]|nr:hypothetical protein [Ramlibacter humi]
MKTQARIISLIRYGGTAATRCGWPSRPGIGFGDKADLIREMRALAE